MKTIILLLFLTTTIFSQPYYKGVNLSDFSYQTGFKARIFQGSHHYYKEYYKGFRLVSIFPDALPIPAILMTVKNCSLDKWEIIYWELVEIFGTETSSKGYDWKQWASKEYKIDVRLVFDNDLTIVIFPLQ